MSRSSAEGSEPPIDEAVDGFRRFAELGVGVVGHGEMEVAPVDAQVVAGTIEDALIAGTDVEDREIAGLRAAPGDRLVIRIDGDDRIDVKQDGNIVAALADGREGEIRHGPREDIKILGECRRKERQRQIHTAGPELVDGARGRDGERYLLHGGDFLGIGAHEAPGLAVDAGQPGDGLMRARPVGRVAIGEPVGERPDAEIRVMGDQGHGGRALLGKCQGTEEHAGYGDRGESARPKRVDIHGQLFWSGWLSKQQLYHAGLSGPARPRVIAIGVGTKASSGTYFSSAGEG